MKWGMRPIFIYCRSAMPGTSPHTGPGIGSVSRVKDQQNYRPCLASRRLARHRFSTTASSKSGNDRVSDSNRKSSELATGTRGHRRITRRDRRLTDANILAAQRWLAQHEGVFVEPASAASIAGLFKCCDSREAACSFRGIPKGSRIVCTVTGHGLKDPDVIIRQLRELKPVAATVSDVRRATEL